MWDSKDRPMSNSICVVAIGRLASLPHIPVALCNTGITRQTWTPDDGWLVYDRPTAWFPSDITPGRQTSHACVYKGQTKASSQSISCTRALRWITSTWGNAMRLVNLGDLSRLLYFHPSRRQKDFLSLSNLSSLQHLKLSGNSRPVFFILILNFQRDISQKKLSPSICSRLDMDD
jgi:hypothetical protein